MSIQSAALHRAIVTAWNANLDAGFKQAWETSDKTKFMSLNDGEAAPGTPLPYCVFEISSGPITTRMSGPGYTKHTLREVPVMFHVFATSTQSRSAKEYAAYLAEAIMLMYGGYTGSLRPLTLTLDTGQLVNFQFTNDYGLRVGEDEHRWTVEYTVTIDQRITV